jgi:hypothetical protein
VHAVEVDVTSNTNFYRTVLAIHKGEFIHARKLIEKTRADLCNTIASLLSEGYSRAYRAMVTMQILSELEEVVDFKQSETLMCVAMANEVAIDSYKSAVSQGPTAANGSSDIDVSLLPRHGRTNQKGQHHGVQMTGTHGDLYVPRAAISSTQFLLDTGHEGASMNFEAAMAEAAARKTHSLSLPISPHKVETAPVNALVMVAGREDERSCIQEFSPVQTIGPFDIPCCFSCVFCFGRRRSHMLPAC